MTRITLPGALPGLLEASSPVREVAAPHRCGVYMGAGVVAWEQPSIIDCHAPLADLGLNLNRRAGAWRAATWIVGVSASDGRWRGFTPAEDELLEEVRWGELLEEEDLLDLRALALEVAHVVGYMRGGLVVAEAGPAAPAQVPAGDRVLPRLSGLRIRLLDLCRQVLEGAEGPAVAEQLVELQGLPGLSRELVYYLDELADLVADAQVTGEPTFRATLLAHAQGVAAGCVSASVASYLEARRQGVPWPVEVHDALTAGVSALHQHQRLVLGLERQ